jgi:GT2 family glycosyltransferase
MASGSLVGVGRIESPRLVAGCRRAVMWLTPTRLALKAAAGFARANGFVPSVRLFLRGVRTLGPAGVIRRAAGDIRAREDDDRYRAWLRAHELDASGPPAGADLSSSVTFSVVVPVFNTDPDLLTRCIESVRSQTYANWNLCICDDGSSSSATAAVLRRLTADPRVRMTRFDANRGIVEASNAALALASGEFVALLDHDDELAPNALAEVARCLASQPTIDVVYTDEDKIDHAGVRSQPHFKPDWAPELLRSCMYVSHLLVVRRSVIEKVGGFRREFEGAQDYDLLLRIVRHSGRIAHVPQVLYHWRATAGSTAESQLSKRWAFDAGARALAADARARDAPADVISTIAGGHYRVRYEIRGTPAVGVLFVWDGSASCAGWFRKLARQTAYRNTQYVCVHRSLLTVRDRSALDEAHAVCLQADADSTLPAALNAAAGAVAAEHLVLLSGAMLPISGDWIDAMLEFSQQDDIGAVGPLILGAHGTIESAGLIVRDGVVLDAFQGEPAWTLGHMGNIVDVRDASAVSGRCLMTRTGVFNEVGKLDARLGALYDVDYGLRVRQSRRRVVVTPHARMRQVSRSARTRHASISEQQIVRTHWDKTLTEDPYYNRNFERNAATFRLTAVEQESVSSTGKHRDQ